MRLELTVAMQFWKRRWVEVDGSGNLVLSPSQGKAVSLRSYRRYCVRTNACCFRVGHRQRSTICRLLMHQPCQGRTVKRCRIALFSTSSMVGTSSSLLTIESARARSSRVSPTRETPTMAIKRELTLAGLSDAHKAWVV